VSPCSSAVLDYQTDWENDSTIDDNIVISSSLVIGRLEDRRYTIKYEADPQKIVAAAVLGMFFVVFLSA